MDVIEKYIEDELSKLDKLEKHDFVQGQKYALDNTLSQIRMTEPPIGSLEEFTIFMEDVSSTKEKAIQFLKDSGIYNEDGELSDNYK